MKAQLPENEAERLAALRQFEILDTEAEKVFDDLTRLAVYICKTPIALITLIDSDRQWFKSRIGLTQFETARDVSFCAHAILQTDSLIIPDALEDRRFSDNPLVTSEPHIRFYAGSPLTTSEGYKLGTLCVVDNVPRELTDGQIAALKTLSYQAMTQLELRREIIILQRLLDEEKKKVQELKSEFS
ncbi:MAG: GAF domain-containing protein [Pyrinomonadaceae bacterium]